MTALILGPDCLSNRTRYDVAAIKFMMLWPTILRCGRQRLILTAAPTGEVLEARWSEIDLEQAAWTIPAGRMKAGREHRVPLAPRCVELLNQAKLLAAGSGERVEPGVPPGLRLFPLCAQPAFLLQPVKGRIKRALIDVDHRARDLLQSLRESVPVGGFER